MREKLIELIGDYSRNEKWFTFDKLADHLIANGVTIGVKPTKAKQRKRKRHAITTETFLAMEKIGQQTHKGDQK